MKAIILAAGKGERLRSVVSDIPKPMIKVGGKPILEQDVCWVRDAGISDLYINLHHLPEAIRANFGDGRRWGVNITYSYEPQLSGTAGAVRKIASDHWPSDDRSPFVVVYGDNLLVNFDLGAIVGFHGAKKGIGTVGLHYREDVSQSGIAVLDANQRIVRFIEKPRLDQVVSHWVNVGIYVLEPEILEYIPAKGSSDFGRDVFTRVLDVGERLYGMTCDCPLTAVDTPEMLERAVEMRGGK